MDYSMGKKLNTNQLVRVLGESISGLHTKVDYLELEIGHLEKIIETQNEIIQQLVDATNGIAYIER